MIMGGRHVVPLLRAMKASMVFWAFFALVIIDLDESHAAQVRALVGSPQRLHATAAHA